MIISSICFILSGLIVVFSVYGKKRELVTGRHLIRLGNDQFDMRLRDMYLDIELKIRSMDADFMKDKLHLFADALERNAIRVLALTINRFGKIQNLLPGKDLPKNKGSVSFFLKHIEKHR